MPSSIVSLLQEYKDVFPKETPHGLPPIRGIEHQIDFVPGATIPNRPAYRSNLEETKELQRQVSELLEKGHVRESMSPCDMGMSNNNDLTLAQASFQLSPQAQQNAKAKMLKSGSSIVCSSRTP
jgi:hypothetical protein